jgi:type 1 fimbria pilin
MNLKYCCWVLALGLFTNATLSWGINATDTLTISGNVLPKPCEIESGGNLDFGDVEVDRAQYYTTDTSTIVKCPTGVDFTISIASVVQQFKGSGERNRQETTMVGIYTTAQMGAAATETVRTFMGGGTHNVPWYGKLYNKSAPQRGPGKHGSFTRNVNVVITF